MKLSKKGEYLICFFLFISFLLFNISFKEKPKQKESNYKKISFRYSRLTGKLAPDFEIELLNGEKIKISEIIGEKCIVLNFFQTWCTPCKEEIPYLNNFYEKYKDKNLIIIGISNEKKEKILEFNSQNNIKFPVGIDDKNLIEIFHVSSFPTTIVIGAEGKITLYNVGAIYNPNVILLPEYNKFLRDLNTGKKIDKEIFIKQNLVLNKVENMILSLNERERKICSTLRSPNYGEFNLIIGSLNGDKDCERIIKEIKEEIKKGKNDKEIIEMFSKSSLKKRNGERNN